MSRRYRRNENGHEREHRNDRTGNETVNDGPESASHANPDANSDTGRADRDLGSAGGAGGLCEGDAAAETAELRGLSSLFGVGPGAGSGSGGGGSDMDEVVLRSMLRGAVQHIEPSDGTLDRLRRAVPARRARRRQAAVGMAAAALLIGTAVPAFVHVANSDGSNAATTAIAGHGEQEQGGSSTGSGSEAGGKSGGGSTDEQADGGRNQPTSTHSPSDSRGKGADGKVDGGADPANSEVASVPACDSGQLDVASAETGLPGADGTVYGTFRIANASGTDCSVSSSGSVGFQAMGAADPAKITVVRHTAGDAAAGLPDPSQEQGTVLLKPAMSYEVKFAWVPKDTCPTSGGSPSPTPTDGEGGAGGGTSAGTGTGISDGTTDTAAQLGSEDGGGMLDGSVSVTHTPEAGAPVAETKIPNACAGTIYWTGLLAPAT